jgi:hypothetical protein
MNIDEKEAKNTGRCASVSALLGKGCLSSILLT